MEYMTFANIIHTLWVSQFVHTTTTKGHVLHKQLLHIIHVGFYFGYENDRELQSVH